MGHELSVVAFVGTLLLVLGVNQLLGVGRSHPEQCRPSSQTSAGAQR